MKKPITTGKKSWKGCSKMNKKVIVTPLETFDGLYHCGRNDKK